MEISERCLLIGRDCDGEQRDLWCDSVRGALETANQMMEGDDHPWRSWEVWSNNPKWVCIAISPPVGFEICDHCGRKILQGRDDIHLVGEIDETKMFCSDCFAMAEKLADQ